MNRAEGLSSPQYHTHTYTSNPHTNRHGERISPVSHIPCAKKLLRRSGGARTCEKMQSPKRSLLSNTKTHVGFQECMPGEATRWQMLTSVPSPVRESSLQLMRSKALTLLCGHPSMHTAIKSLIHFYVATVLCTWSVPTCVAHSNPYRILPSPLGGEICCWHSLPVLLPHRIMKMKTMYLG